MYYLINEMIHYHDHEHMNKKLQQILESLLNPQKNQVDNSNKGRINYYD